MYFLYKKLKIHILIIEYIFHIGGMTYETPILNSIYQLDPFTYYFANLLLN